MVCYLTVDGRTLNVDSEHWRFLFLYHYFVWYGIVGIVLSDEVKDMADGVETMIDP
jgi:hypothetical protein